MSSLKNVLPKPQEAFQGVCSRFTDLHAKLNADTVLDFAIHQRENKTQSQKNTFVKTMRVHSTVSHGGLMQ
jgi:hypothetical protein